MIIFQCRHAKVSTLQFFVWPEWTKAPMQSWCLCARGVALHAVVKNFLLVAALERELWQNDLYLKQHVFGSVIILVPAPRVGTALSLLAHTVCSLPACARTAAFCLDALCASGSTPPHRWTSRGALLTLPMLMPIRQWTAQLPLPLKATATMTMRTMVTAWQMSTRSVGTAVSDKRISSCQSVI